ncbi:JmjC domain-containing protein [Pontibacter sp. G13]|uniref:cupin domain-containing protein n=1 Tax=Pontibacter sp. G13 TaxID=3074898 RepID=UPI00288ACAB7|nr:cupin domain-containing protein [Pontibacter sp. G13]WNJ16379.1 cupin domain-containing protein [Pontibacter sp. G13]
MANPSIVSSPPSISGLSDLLAPITQDDFFQTYWEQKPMILHREDSRYFEHLITIGQVDQLLELHRPTGQSIRVVKDQQPLNPSKFEELDGSLNLNQLYAAYADGYTVVVNEIQRFWSPLRKLCQAVSDTLSHQTVANLYLTPKGQQALKPHHDSHDVFVIQVHGQKHWRIYDPVVETPLHNSFQPIFSRESLLNEREITLSAGDVMYMPRGVPHDAYTTDQSSLHLTIGVHPAQWLDLIMSALQLQAQSQISLRKALPPGYLNPKAWTGSFASEMQETFVALMNEVAQTLNLNSGVHMLAEGWRNQQLPHADGQFESIDQMGDLTAETWVTKRQGMVCSVQSLAGGVKFSYPGNTINGPSRALGAFAFIAQSEDQFQVGDLPGLPANNQIQLIARLIRGGLIKIS